MITNVRDLSIDRCTGCSLCSQVCPFSAITMKENEEGFIIPSVDNEKCKECGKCAKTCTSIHPLEKHYHINTKLCISKEKDIDNSASGGLFITTARYFIEVLHGVVYGVIFDKDFNCIHAEAQTLEEMIPMQNSKYIQSNVGDCYKKAKARLDEGRQVLFSGTPCQIAALKSYLHKEYDNLLTIELVCHGVPNQKYWRKYIQEENKKHTLTRYNFRTRNLRPQGKTTLTATIEYAGKQELRHWSKDSFYCSFIKSASFRESCYQCQYAQTRRTADITMGDCDSEELYPDFYRKESKSIALLNTEKGQQIWNQIKDRFEYTDLNYEEEYKVNTPLSQPSPRHPWRNSIYKDLDNLPWWMFKYKYTEHITLRVVLGRIKSKIIRTIKK